MKFLLTIFIASVLFSIPVLAAEQVDLTVPDQARAGTSTYSVAQLTLDWEHGRIVVRLVGDNGERKEVVFGDADNARAMMRALNTMDLSVVSLHRRIMVKLINDGYLAGIISGAPD